MTRVPLDNKGTCGLTMLCRGSKNVRLLVQSGARSPSWYECEMSKRNDDRSVWVHFPLHEGEKIVGAWVRKSKDLTEEDAQPVLRVRILQVSFFSKATDLGRLKLHGGGHEHLGPVITGRITFNWILL
jgi:hypothetical protein